MDEHERRILKRLKQEQDQEWMPLLCELIPKFRRLFGKLSQDDRTISNAVNEAIYSLIQSVRKLP